MNLFLLVLKDLLLAWSAVRLCWHLLLYSPGVPLCFLCLIPPPSW